MECFHANVYLSICLSIKLQIFIIRPKVDAVIDNLDEENNNYVVDVNEENVNASENGTDDDTDVDVDEFDDQIYEGTGILFLPYKCVGTLYLC